MFLVFVMRYYLYVLYSKQIDRYYVGATQDIEQRLLSHLSNHGGYTSRVKDWLVVYQEVFASKKEAYEREKQVKSWKSRKMIEKMISLTKG